jgi:hypothetical protein
MDELAWIRADAGQRSVSRPGITSCSSGSGRYEIWYVKA